MLDANEIDTMSAFWREGSSRRPANGGLGSFVCIRSGSKLGLVTGGEPTFTLESRQCAGGQTYQTRSLKVRVVPGAAVARTEQTAPLGVEPMINLLLLSGPIETLKTWEITQLKNPHRSKQSVKC